MKANKFNVQLKWVDYEPEKYGDFNKRLKATVGEIIPTSTSACKRWQSTHYFFILYFTGQEGVLL